MKALKLTEEDITSIRVTYTFGNHRPEVTVHEDHIAITFEDLIAIEKKLNQLISLAEERKFDEALSLAEKLIRAGFRYRDRFPRRVPADKRTI